MLILIFNVRFYICCYIENTELLTDDKNIFEGLEEADLLKPGESPNFTWFRDGKPFDPEERFKVLFQVLYEIFTQDTCQNSFLLCTQLKLKLDKYFVI